MTYSNDEAAKSQGPRVSVENVKFNARRIVFDAWTGALSVIEPERVPELLETHHEMVQEACELLAYSLTEWVGAHPHLPELWPIIRSINAILRKLVEGVDGPPEILVLPSDNEPAGETQ